MFDRSRTLRLASVLGLAGLSACAAPSSFDGLTGGTPKPQDELRTRAADPTMDAPRPISPISVSLVSTLRPTFHWKQSAASTGAILEVCRTRACDGDDVVRIDAEGETITVPEDLEPGVWFWRMLGTSKERVGTKPSATWEFVVRGPGARKASDKPFGGVVDVNGDGLPDLVVSSETYGYDDYTGQWGTFPTINVFFGEKDGKLHAVDMNTVAPFAYAGDDALAGGVDTDGDGFSDVIHAMKVRDTGEYAVIVNHGAPITAWTLDDMSGFDYFDLNKNAEVTVPGLTTRPAIRDGGDVNGDGFGDVLVSSTTTAVAGLGGAKGTSTTMPLLFGASNRTSNAVIGAFDADGDGLSDVALAASRTGMPGAPISAARGDRERIDISEDLMTRAGPAEKTVAVASGDFDGDGVADVAATVSIDGRRNVCIWLADPVKLFVPKDCYAGPIGDATYGDYLTAGDLSGKGKDDLLVSAGTGDESFVEVYGVESEVLTIDRVDGRGIGKKLTTIWPGGPGKARWATVDATGYTVLVYEGRTLFQQIPMIARSHEYVSVVHSIR